MASVHQVLADRGFLTQQTQGLAAHLAKGPVSVYAGFDPTADSLHLGHLMPVMALAHFQRAGHRVLVLVGGATGLVGDPSGRSEERTLLTREDVERNAEGIRAQLARWLEFEGPNAARLVDNHEWISKLGMIDWLRDVGKHFTVNYMLAKESVKRRLGGRASASPSSAT